MNIETANRLLQYRKKMNLSQEELAAKIGVSRQAVSKWERAEASPDTDNLILLADIYGVSLDELLKGEKETESETQSEEPENNAENNPDSDTTYKKSDKVSFKHGIHVDSKDGDSVHLNFRDGTVCQLFKKSRTDNACIIAEACLADDCLLIVMLCISFLFNNRTERSKKILALI